MFLLEPWKLLFVILAGWVNHRQQKAISYLRTENQVLREKLGKKRILLDDDQRRRLAVQGHVLGRSGLQEFGTLFTPDTILRWQRQLVAQKWDYSEQRQKTPGRPPVTDEVRQLVLQMAQENPGWGYGEVLGAIDFTTIEVWTKNGLVTYYLLFVMKVATRTVHFAGCTTHPHASWMQQIARNLTDCADGFLRGIRYLLMDRDGAFCPAFRAILDSVGVDPVRLPPKSPNLNSHLERFHLSLKSECLERMIFFGETMLRNAVRAYLLHYHGERNHQGLENRILTPGEEVGRVAGTIQCRERLGGLLKYYHREAA